VGAASTGPEEARSGREILAGGGPGPAGAPSADGSVASDDSEHVTVPDERQELSNHGAFQHAGTGDVEVGSSDDDSEYGGPAAAVGMRRSGTSWSFAVPGVYALRAIWSGPGGQRKSVTSDVGGQVARPPGGFGRSSTGSTIGSTGSQPRGRATCFEGRWIEHPHSRRRLAWEMLGFGALLYDIIMVPLGAFGSPTFPLFKAMDWFIRLFWSLDIPATLLVGYFHLGDLVMAPRLIAIHYARTWLPVDALVVGSDWSIVALEAGSSESSSRGIVRLVRAVRITRLIRLVRLAKLHRFAQIVEDLLSTQKVSIYFGVAKPLLCVLILNHIIACCWYSLGRLGDVVDGGPDWVTSHDDGWSPVLHYVASLHWAFAQFGIGSIDIMAHNVLERLFAIVVMLFGLTMFSQLVGSVSSAMAQLRELRTDATRQFWLLRRYLKDRRISKRLSTRIQRYVEYAYDNQKKKKQESQVPLLSLLSEQLYDSLQCEIHVPILSKHPLFRRMALLPVKVMETVLKGSVSSVELARMDVLFNAGDPCGKMYFFLEGELVYQGISEAAADPYQRSNGAGVHVGRDDWACEPTLWTPWVHVGEMRAVTECRVLALDAICFSEGVRLTHRQSWSLAQRYGAAFLDMLNSLALSNITDLMQASISPDSLMHHISSVECMMPRSPTAEESCFGRF